MRILFIFFLLISCQSLSAQAFLDAVARKTCECAEKIPTKIKGNKRTIRFGLCVMQVASKYKKEFKSDYNLVFGDSKDQHKIGELIGEKMAGVCPETLLSIVTDEQMEEIMAEDDEEEAAEAVETGRTEGKLLNIENKGFIVFEIKNNSINSSKYYWLRKIETQIADFNNSYYNLIGQELEIEYEKLQLFDAKLNDYRNYKVITKVSK